MSKEIISAVNAILDAASVTFVARYAGEKKNALGCKTFMDQWTCHLTLQHMTGTHTAERFDYYTGLGSRQRVEWESAPCYDNGPQPRPGSLLYETWVKSAKPVAPNAADVLQCLISGMSAEDQTFEGWCSDYAYDSDSRSAEATYNACREDALKLRKILSDSVIAAIRDAVQDL
jgi:hypothetical protein